MAIYLCKVKSVKYTFGIFFFSSKSSGLKRISSLTPNCRSCSIRIVTLSFHSTKCVKRTIKVARTLLHTFGVSFESPVESATSSIGTELKQSVVIILKFNFKFIHVAIYLKSLTQPELTHPPAILQSPLVV